MPVTRLPLLALSAYLAWGQWGGELRFCLRSDPKTFDPLAVADDSSETVRYLTGGVLVRVNRKTQQLEPELAESWKVAEGGRKIVFKLRERVLYSEGTPFSAEDVAFTVRRMMDPALHSPTGDSFRSGSGEVRAETLGPHRVSILFPSPIAGLERLFDQVAILSAVSPKAVLGPFVVAEHKAGSHLLLRRNPNYWKKDASGRRLPYLDSVRLDIQQNRDLEQIRFRRGEIHLIDSLDPETFDSLAAEAPASAIDAGPSLDTEMMWFNQVRNAPLPEYKKAWFRSKAFRRAVSESINRDDIARLVYRGHARPAVGPFSPSNRFWFHAGLRPHGFDPAGARRKLEQEGFRLDGAVLRDREGHPVEFSLVTNSGNKTRARIASLLQQDLAKVGIRLNIVPLDFPSLIERINRTFHYEACLLGLVNVDLDPNAQMNVWLSSAANHQWNPNQPSPATPWEAEIDRWMRAQASTLDPKKRKAAFDRVQEIVWEEAPFLYLANRNFLAAISPALRNTAPAAMRPQTFWNVERISFANQISGRR
ncbi:MAG: ABC transporter substrate-binding protein [Acidobacteria bacterium]|nr:ABC transporter substrate-binding protein [Acidobacteriota bacterium]